MAALRSAVIFVIGAVAGFAASAFLPGVLHLSGGVPSGSRVEPQTSLPVEVRRCETAPPSVQPACEKLVAADPGSAPTDNRAASDPAWTALVDGMLEQEVQRRFGQHIDAQKKVRLLGELARLREASLGLQSSGPTNDPEAVRERVAHQVTLLEVDRAFRDELGMGVAQFLQGLDGNAITDVSAPDPLR